MDRKKLELLVLIAGVIVIGGALTLMLTGAENPNLSFYTNIVFAIGFLIYIIYNMMTTASLQKEIRLLNGQIESLKDELNKERSHRKEKETALVKSEEKVQKLNGQVKSLQKECDELKADRKEESNS